MIYLASPYSAVGSFTPSEELQIRERRYAFTLYAQMHLFNYGYPIFSTIVHTHVTCKRYRLPADADYWKRYNHHMIDLSKALFVLNLEGWDLSSGVKDEIDYAGSIGLPIHHIPVDSHGEEIRLDVPIIPHLQTLKSKKLTPA